MDVEEKTAAILKALSHPVRLQILEVLAEEGEACVCHLEGRLDQRQAYISQQLATLRQVGLVEDRREGSNVFYALTAETISPLIERSRKLAAEVAGAQGVGLATASIRPIDPQSCPCPKCEAAKGPMVSELSSRG